MTPSNDFINILYIENHLKKYFYQIWLAFGIVCLFPFFAGAAQSGDFTYEVSGASVTITGYTGSGGNVAIPATIDSKPVVSIGDNAFRYCNSLTNITIPDSITRIGYYAFQNCTGLTSITIPSSVSTIGSCSFYGCTGLTSITILSGVTTIEVRAFLGCTGLTSVAIPDSVMSIGTGIFGAFGDCSGLTNITVDENNPNYSSLNGILLDKTKTAILYCPAGRTGDYTIPNSVTKIENKAFGDCTKLSNITIPNSVTSIGYFAFQNCTGLTSITLPNSVTSISNNAFSSCTNMISSYFYGNPPEIFGSDVFYQVPQTFSIYYLEGTSGWTTPTWNGYPAVPFTEPTIQPGSVKTVTLPNLPVDAIKLKMSYIPAGTFTMGIPADEIAALNQENQTTWFSKNGPQHQVTLTQPFYIGKYVVTQAQWQAVMGSNPASGYGIGPNYPVYGVDGQNIVSWNDCQTFIQNLNQLGQGTFRMPTEAEWEYACRAGTTTRYYWGDDPSNTQIGEYAWYSDNSSNQTHEVGLKKPNAFGLFDMSGNVMEWCQDWNGNYSSTPQTDPIGPSSGTYHVIRGSGFTNTYLFSGYRDWGMPTYSGGHYLGLRLVATSLPGNFTPDISLSPSASLYRGEQREFTVTISDATGMVGYRAGLNYDPNKLSYVANSATVAGTSTETTWGELVCNDSLSGQLIFTQANKSTPLPSGAATLLKFRMTVNSSLADGEIVSITFNNSLTSLNDGAIDVEPQTWSSAVLGPNHAPSFTPGDNQTAYEDCGLWTVSNWATNIIPGPVYENYQTMQFEVTNGHPGLFATQPSIDANGTLTFTPLANACGIVFVTAMLKDNGGTANGGNDTSTPSHFSIEFLPVNDAPSFMIPYQAVTLAEDAPATSLIGFVTGIVPGSGEESGQVLTFQTSADIPSLFSVQPAISSNGTLTFTPAMNANGLATMTVTLQDNGGTANGGIDTSAPQTFTIHITPVNDAPSFFVSSATQTVLEDAGAQAVIGWATGIFAGPADEAAQGIQFIITNNNPSLFSEQPAVSADGTLTFTPAADANGIAMVTAELQDDGGTATGGINTSAPLFFPINVLAVNDAPSFIPGGDQHVLNPVSGEIALSGVWASGLLAGPANEVSQSLSFVTQNDAPGLFSVQPQITSNGALTFTSKANAHGIITVSTTLYDNAGSANGGIDHSPSEVFHIIMERAYQWGDLNADTISGAVDASLILRFDVGLITTFPGFPPATYPEYQAPFYPYSFPPAADLNGDHQAGTLDASLLLRHFALLDPFFPVDLNQSGFGPDEPPLYSAKQARPAAELARNLTLAVEKSAEADTWTVLVGVDNAKDVAGVRLGFQYDPEVIAPLESSLKWLVPDGMLVSNTQQAGLWIIAGALINPLDDGAANLISMQWKRMAGVAATTPLVIKLDPELTQVNDGQIHLQPSSLRPIDLLNPTAAVNNWMLQ